jgi:hypothetical protein
MSLPDLADRVATRFSSPQTMRMLVICGVAGCFFALVASVVGWSSPVGLSCLGLSGLLGTAVALDLYVCL